MPKTIEALIYLESRQLVNRLRRVSREPGRAIVYAIAFAYFIAVAAMRARSQRAAPSHFPEPYASALFFAYVVLLGVLSYGAASGFAGAFSSNADALFLTGSHIPERLVVFWLQLRRSAVTLARMTFSLLLYAVVFAKAGTLAGIGLATIAGAIAASAVAVPVLKLRTVVGARVAQSMAGALAAIGLLPLSIVLASTVYPRALPAAHGVERLGAGYALNALFDGNPLALCAFFVFAASLTALSYAAGSGLFAELYAASLKMLNLRERAKRGGGGGLSMEHKYRARRVETLRFVFDPLRGAWTLAWKEWVAFMRSPSMQRLFWLGAVACAAAGALFGSIAASSGDPLGTTLAFTGSFAFPVLVLIAIGSAVTLASDLRKPLWWIGPDPLWLRLSAWMAGTSWRLCICLGIGITAWSIAIREPLVALAGVPAAVSTVLYLRAIGLALYALFPSSIDQRGPLAMLRALVTFAFAAPPAIAGVVCFALLHGSPEAPAAGITAGIASALLETALLVAFASARISGRGVAFAHAESL